MIRRRLLEVPFYQTQWNGIRLVDLAERLGMSREHLCDPRFYEAFYQGLRERRFALPESWLSQKARAAERVRGLMDGLTGHFGRPVRALSIGAGLGVIELPLLEAGYDVELQECQAVSLEYFMERRPDAAQRVHLGGLDSLAADSYDLIYLSQVVYALPTDAYAGLLSEIHRLLRPEGRLAIWEPEYGWRGVVSAHRHRPAAEVFWGWNRSAALHRSLAERAGFRFQRLASLDRDSTEVAPPLRLFGVALSPAGVTQELIFSKSGVRS